MRVLENDYILKTLDLPTIDWKPYDPADQLEENILWSIKVEEIPSQTGKEQEEKKTLLTWMRKRMQQEPAKGNGLIGSHAENVMRYGGRMSCKIVPSRQMLLYYPYYTVLKSGILDINRNRVVIEGTSGDISNLITNSQIDVTMILTDEDVEVFGDERFFQQDEVLQLIDYSREVRKMAARDMDDGKSIQLMFSYVYRTNKELQPEGDLKLIFHKFKMF